MRQHRMRVRELVAVDRGICRPNRARELRSAIRSLAPVGLSAARVGCCGELSGAPASADSACSSPTCRRAQAAPYQPGLRVAARRRRARAAAGALTTEVQILQGDWIDPERSKVHVDQYVERWIDQRPGLRPKTLDLYRWLLRAHIKSTALGGTELGKLTTPMVRQWRSERLEAGTSEITTAKAYRLVRAALNTAVDEDRIIPRNPCRVKGAGDEDSPERPVLSVAQVFALAGAVPERYRVLILLTAFLSLRWVRLPR